MADTTAAPAARRRRPLLLGLVALVGVLALGAGGWFAWTSLMGEEPPPEAAVANTGPVLLPPPDATYLTVPDITTVLVDAPRVVRVGVMLEAKQGEKPQSTEADMQRVAEEIRRWLATQRSSELQGAVALWTLRGRTLAIARDLYPQLAVRDVLIRTLVVQ